MTCQDCGISIESAGNSKMLALELESLAAPGRCFACEFMRRLDERIIELKGEVEYDDRDIYQED